jgi:hypothetical protein
MRNVITGIILIILLLPGVMIAQQCSCSNPEETLLIKSVSEGDFEIRVWKNSKLIHNHIMSTGDELTVNSNSNILVQIKYLSNHCRTKSEPGNLVRFGRRLENGWIETEIQYEELKKFKRLKILDPMCPQV